MKPPGTTIQSRPRGFSLIEILLVIGIIAVLAIAAFIIFPQVQASSRAKAEQSNIMTMAAGAKSLFNGRYTGLDDTSAIDGNIVPLSMHDGDARITSSWGSDVEITGVAANPTRFTISYVDVPTLVCLKLVPGILRNFESIRLYSGGWIDLTAESPPAQVVSACQSNPNLMIITSA